MVGAVAGPCTGRSFMPSDNSRPTTLTETLLQTTGAYELVLSAMLIGLIGYGLDRWLGTGPALVIAFSIAGFVGASVSLYARYKTQLELLESEQ